MFKNVHRETLLAIGALIVAAICYAGYSRLHGAAQPYPQLRQTLDPNQFQGNVRIAYAAAAHHPRVFAVLKCYGGCGAEAQTQSLYDCFTTDYAAKCPACIAEARIAGDLSERGVPAESIRNILIQKYAKER
ncbi:MAG: PCYCGC motif-containing (lipo)protein [Candidatus Binataceae bacterium]